MCICDALRDLIPFAQFKGAAWLTNNCDTHIVQYLENIFGQLIECNLGKNFVSKIIHKSPRPFSEKLKLSISLD